MPKAPKPAKTKSSQGHEASDAELPLAEPGAAEPRRAGGVWVQFGPTKSPPGSRLKGGR
jgi:hypothetical protein